MVEFADDSWLISVISLPGAHSPSHRTLSFQSVLHSFLQSGEGIDLNVVLAGWGPLLEPGTVQGPGVIADQDLRTSGVAFFE